MKARRKSKKPIKIHGIAIKSLCPHPNYKNLYSPTFYFLKKDNVFYSRILTITPKPIIINDNSKQNVITDVICVGYGGGGLFLGIPKVLDSNIGNFILTPATDSRSYEKSYDEIYNTFPTMLGSPSLGVMQRAGKISYENAKYTNATYIFSTKNTALCDFYAGWKPSLKSQKDVIPWLKLPLKSSFLAFTRLAIMQKRSMIDLLVALIIIM